MSGRGTPRDDEVAIGGRVLAGIREAFRSPYLLALITQAFLTGRIIKWFGLGVALAILPLVTVVGLVWIGVAPTLGVLFVVQVIRRGWNYGLMNSALEALYTVVPREEEYKAKNFIDTTIYRTGDPLGAWSNKGFLALGMSFTTMAFVTVPLAGAWVVAGLFLGAAQRRRAEEGGKNMQNHSVGRTDLLEEEQMASRREFLSGSATVGLALGLGGFSTVGCGGPGGENLGDETQEGGPGSQPQIPRAERPLRILILGGTAFLGPAQVQYALARGHTVTLFNRGRTNPDLFPGVEKLVGDRAEPDYSAMGGREWDAVIDNSANVASWVMDSARLLEHSVGRYLFVSSISAHTDNSLIGQDENGPVFTQEDYDEAIASEAGFGAAFGPNKAQAEREIFKTFGDRGIVVRPGLIVGPRDNSGRFTYWPVRIDRGGEVLAPGDGTDRAQIVDVRDLGQFMVHLIEEEASGTYLATGPAAPLTMAGMLYGIRAVTSTPVSITWVDSDFLQEHEVGGWMEMPVWVYPSLETQGFSAYDVSKAIRAGLTFRPLAETARDTLDWWKSLPGENQTLRTGIDPEKEANILRAWHARNG